ncbi:MAG: M24 family metallopeptidase, partial [Prevotellaceae bacterium]|nr:M24 family metallopeptidase [Prevotellaceae bacterium]
MDRTELQLRQAKIREEMRRQGIDAALIACNVNLLYTLGAIVNGYVYLPVDAPAQLFIKRPNTLSGEHVHPIRKPEQMIDILVEKRIPLPKKLMIEGDLPHTEYMRLSALFSAQIVDASPVIKRARAVKTNYEIELFRRSGLAHTRAYEQIPAVFRKGMTDLDLSIEIERLMRREGCLGIFRVGGQSMEIFMGSLLVGDNAAVPSPYDFALGGAGADASLPVGANGTTIREGQSMMVDYGGNFFGYICDMTRVFSAGRLPQRAYDAHQVCL